MKGLNQNTRPQQQLKDTYRYGKNGLSNVNLGTEQNEPGFLACTAVIPYKFCGAIATDKFPVIFSTDNTNSAIGYFDIEDDVYIPIIDDVALPFKLGFNTDYYITGQAQRNNIGEIVVAYTNKQKVTGYINCDTPDISTINDLSLFPITQAPVIALTQDTGGILAPGAYFAAARYTKKDGTITSFVGLSGVTIVSGRSADALTDKALILQLDEIDQTYDYLEIAIISKTSGVYNTPQLLKEIAITDTSMRIVYSGVESSTNITLETVLIPQAFYTKIGTIGQLNDALYIADLESEPSINMQPWVNMIQVEFKSELMDVLNPDPAHVRGEKRTFMHEEVVSLYIQFSKTSGGWTQWFHVPGRRPSGADVLISSLAAAQGLTAVKYQVEDTISAANVGAKTGSMGIWQNQNETYPLDPAFDSSVIGGDDLRGQQVCHHRFPSVKWCKETFYAADPTYGATKLDLLGLKLGNVQIPLQYADQLNGWRVGYGKRTLANATVQAQGALLHGARGAAYNAGNFTINTADNKYVSTGGNFHSGKTFDGQPGPHNCLGVDTKVMRFHGFDLLYNKPSITGEGYYLSSQLKLRRNNLQTQGFIEDFNLGFNDVFGPIVYLIDYTLGIAPTGATDPKKIRKISNAIYTPNNLINGKWTNTNLETVYGGNLSNSVLDPADLSNHLVDYDENNMQQAYTPTQETTYLSNIMRLRTDTYQPFTAQKIIVASSKLTGMTGTCFGGDTYLVDYSFHTYGWWFSNNERSEPNIGGTKVARRLICESTSNLYGRYEIPGNTYSKWYPHNPLVKEDLDNYITQYNVNVDPNQFGYNKDLSTLSELSVDTGIFNTMNPFNTIHPYRIHRGGQLGRQDKTRSWRTFLPLDYYENVKNFGRIINVDGQQDRLLIHHEKALMVTQDKTKLESDVLGVTLGAADIFQFEPQDVTSAPLGYNGTQHDLSCVRSPLGYFFVDALSREPFLFNGKPEPMAKGMYNLFLDLLKVIPTNPMQGDGITVGYDPLYKRLLLTVKNTKAAVPVLYNPTEAELATLSPGDAVYMHGRILQYQGINVPEVTGYVCGDEELVPIIGPFEFTLDSGAYADQLIAVLDGIFVEEIALLGTSPATSIFTVDPVSKELWLNGTLNDLIVNQWTLNLQATSSTGETVNFVVTIQVVSGVPGVLIGGEDGISSLFGEEDVPIIWE